MFLRRGGTELPFQPVYNGGHLEQGREGTYCNSIFQPPLRLFVPVFKLNVRFLKILFALSYRAIIPWNIIKQTLIRSPIVAASSKLSATQQTLPSLGSGLKTVGPESSSSGASKVCIPHEGHLYAAGKEMVQDGGDSPRYRHTCQHASSKSIAWPECRSQRVTSPLPRPSQSYTQALPSSKSPPALPSHRIASTQYQSQNSLQETKAQLIESQG